MSAYLERAQELRAIVEPHYNCAQAVFAPFAERAGLSFEQACAVADGFGGGMRTGSTCGALTGALMALGVLGLATPENVQALMRRMSDAHGGTVLCAELLRMNEDAGREKKPHCDALVFEAVGLVEECLAASGLQG